MQPAILHLGLGSFHRAHQAVYLQRANALAGQQRWLLASGNIRPESMDLLDVLRAQGGYTLETIAPDGEHRYEWVAAIGKLIPWDAGLTGFIGQGADANTRIISFTVTEAGYASGPDNALFAALAAILRERQRRGSGPVTLLCCDNLRHNGHRSREGLLKYLAVAGDDALRLWVTENTCSPDTMVDRITPRPAREVRERVLAATGRDDPAALMAESYLQWVIEDRFIAGRPAWELAGAELVGDVAPYEDAKIRLLNAMHSCVAWAGVLRGHGFIHEDVADAQVARLAREYATNAVIPALTPSPVDLAAYRDRVLQRFANPAMRDTNQRIVADSFAKIAAFVAPTVRDCLAGKGSLESVALLPALYLAFLRRWSAGQLEIVYEDQALDAETARAICGAADPVQALAAQRGLWGDIAGHPELVRALRSARQRVEALS
jgi:D-arabinitol 4-dehydrogenase